MKPLRRIDETGRAVEVANQQEKLTREMVYAACIKLGQGPEEAQGTVMLYEDESLDQNDIKLIYEAVRELKEEATQIPQIPKRNVKAAYAHARNPKHVKQRVTRRDPITHRVTGLEDV